MDRVTGPMNRIAGSVMSTTERTQRLTRQLEFVEDRADKVEKTFIKIGAVAAGIGFAAHKTFQWQEQLQNQQRVTQQLFDTYNGGTAEGVRLTQELTSNAMALSKVFGADYTQVQESVNALTKQFGIDTTEAFKLVETGFLSGANANGDFLSQLREYPALMKETGINASQMIGIIIQQVKSGVYSDKGVDAIKEAMRSIKNMTPATATAINGLGLSSVKMQQDIASGSITVFDAIRQISTAFAAANPAAKGKALADIFRGPGEDVGEQFISRIGTMNTSLQGLVDKGNPLVNNLQNRLDLERQIATTQQQVSDTISPVSMAIHKRFLEAKLAAAEMADAVFGVVVRFAQANPRLSKFLAVGALVVGGLYALITAVTLASLRIKAFTIQTYLAIFGENGFIASLKTGVLWTYNKVRALVAMGAAWLVNTARAIALTATLTFYALVTGGATAATAALNAVLLATPIGWIVLGIGAVIAVVVSLVKHWDSLKRAFTEGGFIAGIKRIGFVIIDALLAPVQGLLNLISKIPGLGSVAKGADFIQGLRDRMDNATNVPAGAGASKSANSLKGMPDWWEQFGGQKFNGPSLDSYDSTNTIDHFKNNNKDKTPQGVSGGSSGGRVLNQTLRIERININVEAKDLVGKAREHAEQVVKYITDGLNEGAVQVLNG